MTTFANRDASIETIKQLDLHIRANKKRVGARGLRRGPETRPEVVMYAFYRGAELKVDWRATYEEAQADLDDHVDYCLHNLGLLPPAAAKAIASFLQ